MTRRWFLRLAALAVATAAVIRRPDRLVADWWAVRGSWVWAHLPPRRASVHPGAVYRQEHPAERTVAALLAALEAQMAALEPNASDEILRTPAAFDTLVQDDLRRGDTVTIDGWVMTRTEARLCALAALATPW